MRYHLDANLKIYRRPVFFTVTMPLLLNDADVYLKAPVAFLNGLFLAKPAASFNRFANSVTDSKLVNFFRPGKIRTAIPANIKSSIIIEEV